MEDKVRGSDQDERSNGQVAYEAYCDITRWRSLISNAPLPTWGNLEPAIQEAWESAGNAVVAKSGTA